LTLRETTARTALLRDRPLAGTIKKGGCFFGKQTNGTPEYFFDMGGKDTMYGRFERGNFC